MIPPPLISRAEEFYMNVSTHCCRCVCTLLASMAGIGFAPVVATAGEHEDTALMFAAKLGAVAEMQKWLEAGADPNCQEGYGETVLIMAARSNVPAAVELLLERGALDVEDVPALGAAAEFDANQSVALLLKRKFDPNVEGPLQRRPIHFAASRDIAEALVKAGADVTFLGSSQESALHTAAERGAVDVIQYLLSRKLDVNAKDDRGDTPLHYASRSGYPEAVRELLRNRADPNAANKRGVTALHAAVFGCNYDASTDFTNPFLHLAEAPPEPKRKTVPLRSGFEDVMRLIVQAGGNADAPDGDSDTPRLVAAGSETLAPEDRRRVLLALDGQVEEISDAALDEALETAHGAFVEGEFELLHATLQSLSRALPEVKVSRRPGRPIWQQLTLNERKKGMDAVRFRVPESNKRLYLLKCFVLTKTGEDHLSLSSLPSRGERSNIEPNADVTSLRDLLGTRLQVTGDMLVRLSERWESLIPGEEYIIWFGDRNPEKNFVDTTWVVPLAISSLPFLGVAAYDADDPESVSELQKLLDSYLNRTLDLSPDGAPILLERVSRASRSR
jgi:hypothetical protein